MARCQICGKSYGRWLYRRYTFRHSSGFEIQVCGSCARCSSCGKASRGKERVFDWTDSRIYCKDCWESRTPSWKEAKAMDITGRSLSNPLGESLRLAQDEAIRAIVPVEKRGKLILTDARLIVARASNDIAADKNRVAGNATEGSSTDLRIDDIESHQTASKPRVEELTTYNLRTVKDVESVYERRPKTFTTGLNVAFDGGTASEIGARFRTLDFGFEEFRSALMKLKATRPALIDGVAIRRATSEDAKGIAVVHVDTWRAAYRGLLPADYLSELQYEWAEGKWRSTLQDTGKGFVLVASDSTGIIGFAAYGPEHTGDPSFKGEIRAIYVLEGWKKKGIATRLFYEAANDLMNEGMNSIRVWVIEDSPSRQFYESVKGKKLGQDTTGIGGLTLREVSYGWSSAKELIAMLESKSQFKMTGFEIEPEKEDFRTIQAPPTNSRKSARASES